MAIALFIPTEKLTDYLLSETHPVGSSKAKFFRLLGFDERNLEFLESALLEIAHFSEVVESQSSAHGDKYVVDGELETPRGDTVVIRTVWIVEPEDDEPRFVTAYPRFRGTSNHDPRA